MEVLSPSPVSKMEKFQLWLRKSRLAVILISAVILITTSVASIYLGGYISEKRTRKIIEQRKDNLKKINEASHYQELLNKESESSVVNNDLSSSRPLVGNVNLKIVYVTPKSVSDSQIRPLINNLENSNPLFTDCDKDTCTKTASLSYINQYLKSEMKQYSNKDLTINISSTNVLELTDLEKTGDIMQFWGKDPFSLVKLKDAFNNIITSNHIEVNEEDVVAFLYFDDSNSLAPEGNDERFYEYKKFRSFADENKSKFYVDVFDFDKSNSTEIVTVVTHEFLHIFGATDKYLEVPKNGKYCNDEGLGNYDLDPLYPQYSGDIMCLLVLDGKDSYTKGKLLENELVINSYTAKEIGWQ